MALAKCTKCEVNYVKGGAQYCDVCQSAMKRLARRQGRQEEAEEEPLVCTECGEAPATPGHELCAECLKEQKRQHDLENAADVEELDEDEPLQADDEE